MWNDDANQGVYDDPAKSQERQSGFCQGANSSTVAKTSNFTSTARGYSWMWSMTHLQLERRFGHGSDVGWGDIGQQGFVAGAGDPAGTKDASQSSDLLAYLFRRALDE